MGNGIFSLSGLGMILQFADLIIGTKKPEPSHGPGGKMLTGGSFGDVHGYLESLGRELARAPHKRTVVKDTNRKPLTPERRVAGIIAMIHKYEADPRIREIAIRTIAKQRNGKWVVDERDWVGEAKSLFGMMRKEVRYIRDVTGRDTYVSPLRTLAQLHAGDCDDASITGGSLLRSVGFNVVVRIIQTKGNKTFNHVYLLVEIPDDGSAAEGFSGGSFMPFDPSMPYGFGWQAPKSIVIKKRDFKVPVGEGADSRVYGKNDDGSGRSGSSDRISAAAAGLGEADGDSDDFADDGSDGVYYDE